MKKIFTLITCLFLYQLTLYSQIGIGNSSPRGSLDINNHDGTHTYPLVLPANNSTSNMENPSGDGLAPGSIMYDSKEDCVRFYMKANHKWSDCMVADSRNSIYPSNCNKNGFEGSYVQNEVMTTDNKFTIEITNNSFSAITLSLKPEDLTLTGIDPDTGLGFTDTGLNVSAVSPASVTINSEESKLITYTITGTPTKAFTLKGNWKKLALNCSNTVEITQGMAVLDLSNTQKQIASIDSKNPTEINIQGIIDNDKNKLTVSIPYTSGKGVYSAYTSKPVTVKGEGGETNTLTLSFPEGNFSSTGTITATVKVGGNGTFNVKKLDIGETELITDIPVKINDVKKGDINISAIGGILDRNFGDGIHDFVYLPIVGEDGRTWLNHDLGANYTNIHHPKFNPGQRAESSEDFNTYGSLFQWGRLADSHEIIKYDEKGASPLRGTVDGTSSTDIPKYSEFYKKAYGELSSNWRQPKKDNLWQEVNGINNPCPVGYKVPTDTEFQAYVNAANITNKEEAITSKLGLNPGSYLRPFEDGEVKTSVSVYWTATPRDGAGGFARTINLSDTKIYLSSYGRGDGNSVRCIKD